MFRFFSLLKPLKKVYGKVFFASLILSVFGIITAFYFRFLIDEVFNAGLENTLHIFSIGFLAVICFQTMLTFVRNQILLFLGYKIEATLMLSYFKHVLKLPMDFFKRRKTGEIISRMYDTSRIKNMLSSTTLSIIMDSVMIVFGGFFLFLFASKLLIISLVSVFLGAGIVFLFLAPYRRKIKQRAVAEAEKQSTVVEILNGIETIKSISSEEQALDKAEFSIVNATKKNINIGLLQNLQSSLQYLVEKLGMLAIYWIGGLEILKGNMTLGQLISFVILSGYFLGPLFRLLTLQPNLQEAKTSAERLAEIFDEDEEFITTNEKLNVNKLNGNISFTNVSFCYGTRSKTLNNINLTIKAGDKIAFVGESGSGKSTAAKLLMNLHKATEGEITIDGFNIQDYDLKNIRQRIGYIPQTNQLFSGSIAENIGLGQANSSLEQIYQAGIMAKADKFIRKLPNRYSTIVGERGESLSGGERQRIAIARAILSKPDIYILDEATTGLDNGIEKALLHNFNMLSEDKTTIFISHKLETIKHCNQIFVFDKGEIIESGTHTELLKLGGKYYNLWNTQNMEVAA